MFIIACIRGNNDDDFFHKQGHHPTSKTQTNMDKRFEVSSRIMDYLTACRECKFRPTMNDILEGINFHYKDAKPVIDAMIYINHVFVNKHNKILLGGRESPQRTSSIVIKDYLLKKTNATIRQIADDTGIKTAHVDKTLKAMVAMGHVDVKYSNNSPQTFEIHPKL